MKFATANDIIKSKVIVPTTMSSAELAMSDDFNSQVKAHCFFSAKVSQANVLAALKKEVEKFTAGETDFVSARARLKTFLQKKGYYTSDIAQGKKNKEYSVLSDRRIRMIFDTNAKQAAALARYNYDMHPDMRDVYPNFIYEALDGARSSHAQYDGLILSKEDPFWDTHTPPWDYGCRCAIYNSDAPTNAKTTTVNAADVRLDYKGKVTEIMPNKSGYTFKVDNAFKNVDMDMINSVQLRRIVLNQLHQHAKLSQTKFTAVASAGGYNVKTVLPDNIKEIEAVFADIAATNSFSANKVSLGKLLPGFADSLGIKPAELFFSQGSANYGLKHFKKHHKKLLKSGKVVDVLKECLWNRNALSAVALHGNKQRMLLISTKNNAYCTLMKVGNSWEMELTSAELYDQNKIDVDLILGQKSQREQNR